MGWKGSPRAGERAEAFARVGGGVTARCREGEATPAFGRAISWPSGESVTSMPSSLSNRNRRPAVLWGETRPSCLPFDDRTRLPASAAFNLSLRIWSSTDLRFSSLRLASRSATVSTGSAISKSASCSRFVRRSSGDGGR